eukprot:1190033-Prorocentrum_minimum.AAC.5
MAEPLRARTLSKPECALAPCSRFEVTPSTSTRAQSQTDANRPLRGVDFPLRGVDFRDSHLQQLGVDHRHRRLGRRLRRHSPLGPPRRPLRGSGGRRRHRVRVAGACRGAPPPPPEGPSVSSEGAYGAGRGGAAHISSAKMPSRSVQLCVSPRASAGVVCELPAALARASGRVTACAVAIHPTYRTSGNGRLVKVPAASSRSHALAGSTAGAATPPGSPATLPGWERHKSDAVSRGSTLARRSGSLERAIVDCYERLGESSRSHT